MEDIGVHLFFTASMNVFADNTLASFKNQLPQNISIEGDWRVAFSEIIFPSYINHIYTHFFYHVYNISGKEKLYEDDDNEKNNEEEEDVDKINVEKKGTEAALMYYPKTKMKPGQCRKISNVLFALYSKISWNMLQDGASRILEDGRVELEFNANAVFTVPNRNIPNLLGFRGRETIFASIMKMKILEKMGECLGTFQSIFFSDFTCFSCTLF